MSKTTKIERALRRKQRVRARVVGTAVRPRLAVFKSGKHLYAQIVNDEEGNTLVAASDFSLSRDQQAKRGNERAFLIGQVLAAEARHQGIRAVAFDRKGYAYHGQVQALAEGAREGGLVF